MISLAEIENILREAGFEYSKKPTITGMSGVKHSFDFIFYKGDKRVVMEVCKENNCLEEMVLRVFCKGLDVRADDRIIICNDQLIVESIINLSKSLGVKVMSPSQFRSLIISQ
ncbi:hypothetical protein DRN86_03090 [Candidatus Geothermarchaeota archaeon]|nr:MAG: hypothetical protein DRN86_03090 [Candidatus Geothermarchaeota archaeon]